MATVFLDPGRKLVEAAAEWLCGRIETDASGARSLAHLMVIVPTAQAGRNLRFALAKNAARRGWGGILPPETVLPFSLVVPSDRSLPDANMAETAALFMRFVSTRRKSAAVSWPSLFKNADGERDLQAVTDTDAGFALLDQMSDIWRVLSGKGLLMRDVTANDAACRVLEEAHGEDKKRWEELASFEKDFFEFLEMHGVRHPAASVALARKSAAPLDPSIREIVLPALSDPILVLHDVLEQHARSVPFTTLLHCSESDRDRFDGWGCPKTDKWTGDERPSLAGLADCDIASLPDDRMLAERIVRDFPPHSSGLRLPALGLCDTELFTAVSAAFLNNGYAVQNPERNMLSVSSLGMLLGNLLALWRPADEGTPWEPFASLMRSDDVLAALMEEGLSCSRSQMLQGLDVYQNVRLPAFLEARLDMPPAVRERDKAAVEAFAASANVFLSWLEEARKDRSLVGFLRAMLNRIFSARRRSGGARSEKEFSQAADCVRETLSALSGERVEGIGLSDAQWTALARRLFGTASYSLESEEPGTVKTEGWLELAWSLGDKVALAGLHEGSVPDSVVGHAFLPNGLRTALGLVSNTARLARDTWLLKELVDSRAPHDVKVYVSRTNGSGDFRRPSRLLFLCPDGDLASRTGRLFGNGGESALTPPRTVSAAWIPRLPDEVPLKRDGSGREYLSPSAIDTYLKSPLEYLFRYGLGMGDRYEDKKELGFDDYGSIVHRALETFANGQKENPLEEEAEIREALNAAIDREIARFGAHPTVNVRLQLESARTRILRFAKIQSRWAKEGWRVEGTEIPYCAKPFDGTDVLVKGVADRVDWRWRQDGGGREFRIVDYKTWDSKDSISGHMKSGAAGELEFAARLRLPVHESSKRFRMLTVQLPLYGACLKAQYPERFDGPFSGYDYIVLTEDENGPEIRPVKELAALSLETARIAIERIKANIFWPPRAGGNRDMYDFGRLFSISPEKDFGAPENACEWLARQEAKLKELENA